MMTPDQVIDFWFKEINPKQHWTKDPAFDAEICRRFGETHQQATTGELFAWRNSALGRLAEVIVLDQFSRNIFRDKPEAFVSDGMALLLSQELVASQLIFDLPKAYRGFAIMPYMHSESLAIHDEALKLFANPELGGSLEFEVKHRDIIVRFGRYPHRNDILGRKSTAEEIEFLKGPNSGF